MAGPTVLFQTGIHSARPAANSGCVLYSCTTHGLVYRSDGAAWTTWLTLTAAGAVGTDSIWDAAGDLAVGSGADTAARLAKGAAGAVLGMSNGAVAWNAGTSFPGSPATNDRYYRTDILGGTELKYDGTRWRSVQTFVAAGVQELSLVPGTASSSFRVRMGLWQPTYSVYLLELRGTTIVLTTNSGSHFYTLAVKKGSDNSTIGSFTTASDTVAAVTQHVLSINAATSENYVYWDASASGTPGNLYPILFMTYQIIAT